MQKTNKLFILSTFLLLTVITRPLFSQCNNSNNPKTELKILSWNIYMLPHFIKHSGQIERAKEIVETLKNELVDVIVFEEAFDQHARQIIREGLKNYFPYESGNPQKNKFYKINSGVWVVSKVPLSFEKQIYFNNSKGTDKLACKGAMLIKAIKNNCCFQIIATHLQSDLKHKDVTTVRYSQYLQIRKELLEPYGCSDIPQFIVGDMNTISTDSLSYNQMTNILNVEHFNLTGENSYSYDTKLNDILKTKKDKPQLIDYIFINKKSKQSVSGNMRILHFRKKWHQSHQDLSDHFAVLGTFIVNQL